MLGVYRSRTIPLITSSSPMAHGTSLLKVVQYPDPYFEKYNTHQLRSIGKGILVKLHTPKEKIPLAPISNGTLNNHTPGSPGAASPFR